MRLDDPDVVRREYADESRFSARAAAWKNSEGPDPRNLAVEAVAEVRPRTVLEVGCGRGELAERIQRELGCELKSGRPIRADGRGTMTFPDREAAREYVAASIVGAEAADELPDWEGPLVCTRLSRIFVAERAA